jgi:endoglycosylceramidase
MRRGAGLLPLALAAAACGGGDDGDGDACPAGARVCRGQLRDDDGRAVILRGMNVSGSNKAAPYVAWHDEAALARLRDDWGLNAVRWVMPWAAVEPAEGAYDEAYLDLVEARLDWAHAHGLAVVLDLHQDVYGEGFGFDGAPRWTCDPAYYDAFEPREPWPINYFDDNVVACFDRLWNDPALGAAFSAAWGHVAARLGDHPAVLGFDIINEPHWGSHDAFVFEQERLQPFYLRVISAVRAEAPGWVAFVEPAASRNVGIPTSLTALGVPDVVYAPHSYDAQAEQGNGFDADRRDNLLANLVLLRQEAEALGAALWIGEYGGLGTDPTVGPYLDAGYDGAAAVAASSMYWDYERGGYGPLDGDGAEVPAIVEALARPYPAAIAGDPVDWAFDDATGALTARWRPAADARGPTELIMPARRAPAGVTVACDGCAYAEAGDVVAITTPPATDADGVATVTVRPRAP